MTALTPDDLARIEELAEKARSEMADVTEGLIVRSFAARSMGDLADEIDALVAGVRSLQEENAALEDARDEVHEKIAYLRRNCMGISEQELRQKIGAVGSAEWARGYYWNTLVAEHRDKQVAAEVAQRQAEAEARSLQARIAELEQQREDVWDAGATAAMLGAVGLASAKEIRVKNPYRAGAKHG